MAVSLSTPLADRALVSAATSRPFGKVVLATRSVSDCHLDQEKRDERSAVIRAALGADFLGPLLASTLFGDVPRSLLAVLSLPK